MNSKMNELAIDTFVKYDTNKNGFIEPAELKALVLDTCKKVGLQFEESDVEELLREFDLNNDKKISKEEFLALFEVVYNMKKH